MLMLGFFSLVRRVRLARFALKTLTPPFTDFFTDFEKKTIVLQSTRKNIFLTFSRRKTYNTVKRTCLKHQYYAVKSQYHLVQSPISGTYWHESTVKKKKKIAKSLRNPALQHNPE